MFDIFLGILLYQRYLLIILEIYDKPLLLLLILFKLWFISMLISCMFSWVIRVFYTQYHHMWKQMGPSHEDYMHFYAKHGSNSGLWAISSLLCLVPKTFLFSPVVKKETVATLHVTVNTFCYLFVILVLFQFIFIV